MPAEEKFEDLGKASYWQDEITAAEKELEKFHSKGKRVLDRFLDKGSVDDVEHSSLNLFHSNIVTLRSMLYGQTPKVDVSRRYEDSQDDVARTASEIMERCLNNDIQFTDDSFSEALRFSLDDYLLPGLGTAKIRYEPKIGHGQDGEEILLAESAPVDYVYWKDFLWSAGSRRWQEVRWVAFRTYLSRAEVEARWKKKVADKVNYTSKGKREEREDTNTEQQFAEIYEIWCKKSKSVYWWSKGMDFLIEKRSDPLQLLHFFPCPQPMLANITTTSLVPKADYTFAQDLYNQIDILTTRIRMLTKAVKVVGVYDKSSIGVQRMLNEGVENELIPVDNWAAFAEKGGIKGQVDWMPIEQISAVLQNLEGQRSSSVQLLYQVTGLSDILRGSTDPRETKGAQELKSKFASIRIQAMQDLFAKFATDLQKLKAEIICKHYAPQTIISQSNIMATPDAKMAEQAVALLKDPRQAIWRIQIRPESIAMTDYAQLKTERTEYLMAISQFMQSSAPLAALDKSVTPTLLEMLKWGLAGFKGSQQIEGVLDQSIAQVTQALQQPPQPPPPDPKVEAAKIKAQADQQLAQQEFQQKQMEFQQQMQQDQQKFAQEMEQMRKEFELKMAELIMTMKTKNETARVDAEMNAQQRQAEVISDVARTAVNTDAEAEKHAMGIEMEREKAKFKNGAGDNA